CEPDVARERLEEGDPAFVAALVGGEWHGAEAGEGALASLRGAQTLGDQFSRFTLDVERELFIELPLDRARPEQRAKAEFDIAEGHWSEGSGKLHDPIDRR